MRKVLSRIMNEYLRFIVTVELTLSGMSAHMLLQRRRFRKVLMTKLALERPVTCMRLH